MADEEGVGGRPPEDGNHRTADVRMLAIENIDLYLELDCGICGLSEGRVAKLH